MKKEKLLLTAISFSIALSAYSQNIKWAKGQDLNFLNGEKSLKVVILYDSMKFENGKSEKEYQATIAKEYNDEKPGKGDTYLARWEKSKGPDGVFYDRFLKDFEGCMRKIDIKANQDVKGNKYILKVYPLYTETGAPSPPGHRGSPAITDFRMVFAEESNPENVVGSVFIEQMQGFLIGKDYDMSFIGRFKNCFWFGGLTLGREMVKIKRNK